MKTITADIKTFTLDRVTVALRALDITSIRVGEIPAREITDLLPRVRISVETPDDMDERVAEILETAT